MALTRAQKIRDSVVLDDIAYLIQQEEQLDLEIKKATAELKIMREQIIGRIKAAGATYGTVYGRPVVRYAAIDKIAVKSLVDDQPDITAPYIREVVREELDLDAFKRAHPMLVEQYRVHAWGREK
jgi:hypothetical protein